jgi:NitT/TauT family transport system substrate-binding protein
MSSLSVPPKRIVGRAGCGRARRGRTAFAKPAAATAEKRRRSMRLIACPLCCVRPLFLQAHKAPSSRHGSETETGDRKRGKPHMRALALLVALVVMSVTIGSAQETPLIRVGSGPDDTALPLVYAIQSGMFKRAGLNVEFEKLAGAAVVAAALAGGSLEIGKASTTGVVTAFAKGLPFTVLGSIANYDPEHRDVALVVAAKSSVRTAKDLVGQTLAAVSLQDQGSVSTFAWLAQRGVDYHSLKIVEISASAALAAMDDNRIVASALYEPYLSADLATGRVRVLGYPFEGFASRFSEAVLFANVNWANTHREIIERFLRVEAESTAYVGSHESELVPMLAQFGGMDLSTVQKINHPARATAIAPSDIQPVIDALFKYNVIPKAFPAAEMICPCALKK